MGPGPNSSRDHPAWGSVVDAGSFGEMQVIAGSFDVCEAESKRLVGTLRKRYGGLLFTSRLFRQLPRLLIVSLDRLNIPFIAPEDHFVIVRR